MALLEYANRTVPDVVQKSLVSATNTDPLLKDIRAKSKVKRSGGTHVRIIRTKSRHSDAVGIDGTNLSIPLDKLETTSAMTGDWGRIIKPIILAHPDLTRMSTNEERKQYIADMTDAAVTSLMNAILRQLYVGDAGAPYNKISTLHGDRTGLPSSGFQNGALQFAVPASQTGTYLNETRTADTTIFDANNWFSQYVVHGGFGSSALRSIEQMKITADTYATKGAIGLGILSISDHVLLGDEVRAVSGSSSQGLHYTVEDIEKNRAVPTVWVANGIRFYANRYMSAANMGHTGSCYLLNTDTTEWWVNAGYDFMPTKFTNHLEHSNQDADVAYIIAETQFAIANLMANALIST
jgi:hypothetical protein